MATVVAKLQQAFDNHILSLKYGDTNPAVDEACKNAIMQMQQKNKELVDSLAEQTEKVVLQRLDESLRNSTDTLIKQLRTSTDAVQDLIQQAQPSQSTFMQDLAANLLRTLEDCLQRFEEQIGPRIIEKARERAIALAEEKGQELVMSMVAQTEKVVQQRLEESLQTCTETMAGHMRTVVDAIQGQFRQGPSKQGHTSPHYEEAWKSQYDSRISTEISELKLAIAALNASTQQNQKLFQEQLRLAKRLSHQGLSERKGSSSDRVTPMDHQSSLSPMSVPGEAQAHPPEAEATRHDDEQGVTVLAIQPPSVLPPIVPLSESPSITILTEANNCATEQKAAVEGTVMGKRAQAQIRGPCSSTNAAGSGRQNPTSVGESSTRGLSAVAIGKQVARQDVLPYVAINPAGVVRRAQVQAQTSTTDSSSILASNASTAFSTHLQRESNFPQVDFDGNGAAYVVIHGMNGPSSIPTCAKRGRGRPRKNNYNANIGLPSDDPATSNKRMKVDLATMGSRTGKVAIKAEDIIELTPRVTRSSGKMNHPGIVYWDLETAAQRIQEAGIRFSF
ncbi:hypothetical protein BGZ97_001302 [Linnemannia gamsii]|uniref:Uncharacterized protein n=1 Tax=Linnemannia gamsii TaxID=64522 RepID=A0A9P6QWW6_9FUNG|nr:hypothetical protein BGZ97_001302 [Linnemannia gamsii]